MAIIYKITNTINGKAYIGATIKPLQKRWNSHKCDAKNHNTGQAIHDAIRKYGVDAFTIEQLYEDTDANFVFNMAEALFIEYYGTHGSKGGYNMTDGGDGWLGMKHTEETKKKIGDKNRGKKRTPEQIEKMSIAATGRPAWNGGMVCPQLGDAHRGKRLSEERRQQLSESHKNVVHTPDTLKKFAKAHSETHDIVTPEGDHITVENLRQYCKEKGISQGCLVGWGRTKGYKILCTHKKTPVYTIQDTNTGEVFITDKISHFCKERDFSCSGLLSKFKKSKPYLNWQILSKEIREHTKKYI